MENGKDYIYEYSDLNRLYTRVKILTGQYKNVVFEYGDTVLKQQQSIPDGSFTFNYIVYEKPDDLTINLRGNLEFETFVSDIIVSVIGDRKKDRLEYTKAKEAIYGSMASIKRFSRIHINKSFYSQR